MSNNLILISTLFSIFIIGFILYLVHKEEINIKYALVWIILFCLLLVCLCVPGLLNWITKTLGFKTASNMVIALLIAVLIIINIAHTVINSNQDKKIRLLIQEISLLKNKLQKEKKE